MSITAPILYYMFMKNTKDFNISHWKQLKFLKTYTIRGTVGYVSSGFLKGP